MNQSYLSLGAKGPAKRLPVRDQSLEELVRVLKDESGEVTSEQVVRALCEDLKSCLDHEDLKSCLQHFFKIEHYLHELEDEMEQVPSLKEFYEVLSPTLLRVVWEGLEGEMKLEELKDRWLEALRVSLEEEFYLWQEKIVN